MLGDDFTGFMVTFPCRIIVPPATMRIDASTQLLSVDSDDEAKCLAVFTDRDLAERFVIESGVGKSNLVVLNKPQFVSLLEHREEIQFVAFDPPLKCAAFRYYSRDSVLNGLR